MRSANLLRAKADGLVQSADDPPRDPSYNTTYSGAAILQRSNTSPDRIYNPKLYPATSKSAILQLALLSVLSNKAQGV